MKLQRHLWRFPLAELSGEAFGEFPKAWNVPRFAVEVAIAILIHAHVPSTILNEFVNIGYWIRILG